MRPAGPASRSVTEMVGPTFEGAARDALSRVLRAVCPWATDFSPIISRKLDGEADGAREADLFCYVSGESLAPCVPLPEGGVAVAAAAATGAGEPPFPQPPLPPMELPAGSRVSPADASREGLQKCFLAEAYSGLDRDRIVGKVVQLDTLVAFAQRRWSDRSGRDVADVSQVVGAAALSLSCDTRTRRDVMATALRLVREHSGESLRRLTRAGRLCVMVLDKSQSPVTYFQRAVADELGTMVARLHTVDSRLHTVHEEVHAMHKLVTRFATVGTVTTAQPKQFYSPPCAGRRLRPM